MKVNIDKINFKAQKYQKQAAAWGIDIEELKKAYAAGSGINPGKYAKATEKAKAQGFSSFEEKAELQKAKNRERYEKRKEVLKIRARHLWSRFFEQFEILTEDSSIYDRIITSLTKIVTRKGDDSSRTIEEVLDNLQKFLDRDEIAIKKFEKMADADYRSYNFTF